MQINEIDLKQLVKKVLKETLDTSYRGYVHRELPDRIKDWDWSDTEEADIENTKKLSKRLRRDIPTYCYSHTGNDTDLDSELKKLGFTKLHYRTMGGDAADTGVEYFMIEKDKFQEVKKKYESVLNFFNYICIKMSNYDGQDFGYDIDGIRVTLEPVYTHEINDRGDRVFYHATPDRNVAKILRQGLVPKDRGQLGVKRPERIYLTREIDTDIIDSLERENNQEYTILKVDLTSLPDVKLYNDPYYDNKGICCLSYIPPKCISVVDNQVHKIEKQRQQEIKQWINELCSSLGLTYDGSKITGEYNGMSFNLYFGIYSSQVFYYCKTSGYIDKPNKNGKLLRTSWQAWNGLFFKMKQGYKRYFKYEEVKPFLIDKILKQILTKGSKSGINFT